LRGGAIFGPARLLCIGHWVFRMDLEEIRHRFADHVKWLARKNGRQLSLRGQKVRLIVAEGFNFSNAILIGAEISYCGFQGADFHNAHLSSATFSHCNLIKANFEGARLTGTRFIHSDAALIRMKGAIAAKALAHFDLDGHVIMDPTKVPEKAPALLVSDLSGSNFAGADLAGAQLKGAKLAGASFANANLAGANLEDAILDGAVLTGANLEGVRLEGAKLSGAVFSRDAKTRKWVGHLPAYKAFEAEQDEVAAILAAHSRWADTEGAEGQKALWSGRQLAGIDFSRRNLAAADFRGCWLNACSFEGATLAAGQFDGARISFCNMAETDLRGASLETVQISFSNLKGAHLGELALAGRQRKIAANLNGASFFNCDLAGAAISDDQIRSADFRACRRA